MQGDRALAATNADADLRDAREAELKGVHHAQFEGERAADDELVPRAWVARSLDADLFLVGQALGRDTQRLSGHPYVFPGGPPHRLSRGGAVLDSWLREVGATIDHLDHCRSYAYHADIHPGYPGRAPSGGDVVPTGEQTHAASKWLQGELEIVAPRVVICLGKESARTILETYAGVAVKNLKDATSRTWSGEVGGATVKIVAIYHPSRAWQFPSQAAEAWAYVRDALGRI